MLSLSFFFLA
uniref:Uncharacterized protein n=1 Tax=Rhizophora mucronata TaxID=61149 RepID=A0A2P2QBU4_RHIMU